MADHQRIQRARKRVAQAVQLAQMAEVRTTRTRRSTKKVDYAYQDDIIEELDVSLPCNPQGLTA